MTDLPTRARRVIPGGANSGARIVPGLEDMVVTSASGATVTDQHGRTYVDYHAAYGPVILGHGDPDVLAGFDDACRRYAASGAQTAAGHLTQAHR